MTQFRGTTADAMLNAFIQKKEEKNCIKKQDFLGSRFSNALDSATAAGDIERFSILFAS